MSDTDYMPPHMDSISETQSGNESPVILGTPTTQEQRKSRAKKRQNQHHEQESALASAQQEHERKKRKHVSSDSSRSPSPPPKKKGRTKTSAIWNHCHQKGKMTHCNYCSDAKWALSGSTSTALYHLKQKHLDELSPEDLLIVNVRAKGTEETSSSSKLPARAPRTLSLYNKISQSSPRGQDLNVKLCLALINSSAPFTLLDNPDWGVFLETLSFKQYNMPSRQYMTGTVIPFIYKACKTKVITIIDKVPHIALTSDAWKSFAKQSYIGLTCHIINHKGELLNFHLSTTEIKKRHTSQNLREHIQTEVIKWGLEYDSVTTNFNQTNENDIQSQTENIQGEGGLII